MKKIKDRMWLTSSFFKLLCTTFYTWSVSSQTELEANIHVRKNDSHKKEL